MHTNDTDGKVTACLKFKTVPVLLFSLALLTHAVAFGCYRESAYEGDGDLEDKGVFASNDRFTIKFPEISIVGHETVEYVVSGAPPAPLTLHLMIVTDDPSDGLTWDEFDLVAEELERVSAGAIVSIVDENDGIVCNASGKFTEHWVPYGSGIPYSSDMRWGYWHQDCRDIRLQRHETYYLRIKIRAKEVSDESIRAEPVLAGGGWK